MSCFGHTQIPCSLGALKFTHMEMKEVFLKANSHKEKKKEKEKKKCLNSSNSLVAIILGSLISKSQSSASKI